MLQQDEPDDYVLATGDSHSVRELTELAFAVTGRAARTTRKCLRGMTKSCGWRVEAGGVPWVLLPDTHFPVKEDTLCKNVRQIWLQVQQRESAMC